MPESGTLYVCATPIGNLGDITLRVLEVLKNSDIIAAEDTRHSRKLLDHYDIKKPLISYHQHNEKQRTEEIITRLKNGENIALISDAGMPGISDPGQIVIRQCLQEELKVDVLPGPNAAVTALVLSGMPADNFLYLGFLPVNRGDRRQILEQVAELPYTIIFYEAPHKLMRTFQDILDLLGDRQAVVARELTKVHQKLHKGSINQLMEEFNSDTPKGECCLLLAPYKQQTVKGSPFEWLKEVERLELEGIESKEAMKIVAKKYGVSKRDIYQAKLKQTDS